jgi:membrane protease YdiL (CAAX protease family)
MSSDDAFLRRAEHLTSEPPAPPPALPIPHPAAYLRPARPPHPNVGWAFLWCLGFILFTQIPAGLVAVAVIVGAYRIDPTQVPLDTDALMNSPVYSVATAAAFVIAELLVIGISWLVLRLVAGRDWDRQVALRPPGAAHVLLVLASFPGLVLVGDGSYYVLRRVLHLPSVADLGLPGMEEMGKVFGSWPAVFAVLVIGLGPGLGEELWCRGFLGRGLVGRHGVVLGVLFSSFFFGLIHLDPCQGTMAALMGLWLHFVYLTTRSLWMPILLHFLNNSLAVLSSRHPLLKTLEQEAGAVPWPVYLAAGVLLLAVGWALYRSRARLVGEAGGPPPWEPACPGVEYPPPGTGTRVAHPVPDASSWAVLGGAVLAFAACAAWAFGPQG